MTDKDREMLVRVDERTARLIEWTKAHTELHTRLSLAFAAATVTTVLALVTTIVNLFGR